MKQKQTPLTHSPQISLLLDHLSKICMFFFFFLTKWPRVSKQGSNWLLAVRAEKHSCDSKRILSSGGFGGRFRPQMGSKGSALGMGPGGRAQAAQAILVFKAI